MGLRDTIMIKLWESIQMGETVLFERVGEGDIEFGLYQVLGWAEDKGLHVIVIDVLDSYPTAASKIRLMGFNEGKLPNVEVIKIGGSKKFGKVIAHITEISEPAILARKFKEAYEPLLQDPTKKILCVAVGLEKLFMISDLNIREVQLIVSQLAGYVGRLSRIGVYLVKKSVLPENREFTINLLEDIATTVIRTEKKGRMTEFHILKSLNKELEGVLIRI